MNYFFVLIFCLSIFGLSINQSNGQSGTGANSGGGGGSSNSGTSSGTNSGNTGTNTGDGSQGYNQGYSYNTGIRPYQTGFTFYQPFGDSANTQNGAGTQNTGAKTGGAQAPAPAAQPVVPIGYQPVYAVQQGGSPVQPVQFQNVPQIVHFGQIPTQVAQPIPVQPIQLPNFDDGSLQLDGFGLGGNTQNKRRQNTNTRAPAIGNDFNPADFGIDLGGGGGGGNNNNNNNNNGFFSQPNNNNNNNNNDFGFPTSNANANNGYDTLPDDSSLANFANLGGGQSNDYPDNDFGNLGDFGSATQNRGTFDILPNFDNGFFKRK